MEYIHKLIAEGGGGRGESLRTSKKKKSSAPTAKTPTTTTKTPTTTTKTSTTTTKTSTTSGSKPLSFEEWLKKNPPDSTGHWKTPGIGNGTSSTAKNVYNNVYLKSFKPTTTTPKPSAPTPKPTPTPHVPGGPSKVVPGTPLKGSGEINVVDYGGQVAQNPSLGLTLDNPKTKTNEDMNLSNRVPNINPTAPGTNINPKDAKYGPQTAPLPTASQMGTVAEAGTSTAQPGQAGFQKAGTAQASTAQGKVATAGLTTGTAAQAGYERAGTATGGEAATAEEAVQGETHTYEAKTTIDDIIAKGQMEAAQGELSEGAIIDENEVPQLDMQGTATGMNADGSVNWTGVALNEYASLGLDDVDPRATVQGQMMLLQAQFKGPNGEPIIPPFAAGVARNVSRIAAFKGMSGTAATAAMSQALMEASIPIAQQDAQFFQTITLQNLSNKQASVLNKANVLAKFDLTNVDNRMAAAIENSKSFLQMDMANLDNRQQAAIINTQARVQSILEDAKAINTQRMFTADSQNQMDRFYDELNSQIQQFNASQINTMKQFNASEINQQNRFNADQFNAQSRFNASEKNDMTALNVTESNQQARFNADARNSMTQFNVDQANQQSRFNADAWNVQNRFNADQYNAQARFNTEQLNDIRKFNSSELNANNRFNATSKNEAMKFNVTEANAMKKFNAELENQRTQFYKNMQYNIDISNAKWRQTVTLQESQMAFEAAATDVKNMVGISNEHLNRLWDRSDSLLDYLWQSTEKELDRKSQLALAKFQAKSTEKIADKEGFGQILGSIGGSLFGSDKFLDFLF